MKPLPIFAIMLGLCLGVWFVGMTAGMLLF